MDPSDAKASAGRMAAAIREEMKKQHVTIVGMAEEMGMSENALRDCFRGKTIMPAWVMIYIADVLGYSVKVEREE